MDRQALIQNIHQKNSFLCIGLDTDPAKIPSHLHKEPDPIFTFNKSIIDATHDLCVAYKPNIAFYEAMGIKGWESLHKTLEYIPKDCFTIADAKRGDIGNTSKKYAETFYNTYPFDSITVAPYMGSDSVMPFLEYKDKWTILLALTSNQGAFDFQNLDLDSTHDKLYKEVIRISSKWGSENNMMYVVGATKASFLKEIRQIIPDHFLLVPGVGAQGGSLEEVVEYGINKDIGLLVNSSRGIIYAGKDKTFATKARESASIIRESMASLMQKYLN